MSEINFVTEYSFESTRYHGNFCCISIEVFVLFIDIAAAMPHVKVRKPVYCKLCDLVTTHANFLIGICLPLESLAPFYFKILGDIGWQRMVQNFYQISSK